MKTPRALQFSAAFLLLTAQAMAANFVTVSPYDENTNQPNTVDTNASGNALASLALNDLAGFRAAVATAFADGQGGVVNFDLPNGANTNANNDASGVTASYAGGTKTLTLATITSNSDSLFNFSSFTTLTPISGGSTGTTPSKGALPTTSTVTAFRLSLSGAETVLTVGFTLLSRSIAAQDVLVEWFIDGNLVTAASSDTEAIASSNAGDDTFFSYTAPAGSTISDVRVAFLGTAPDRRLAIDDFGFITQVPEPGSGMLALIGSAAMLLRRRRGGGLRLVEHFPRGASAA